MFLSVINWKTFRSINFSEKHLNTVEERNLGSKRKFCYKDETANISSRLHNPIWFHLRKYQNGRRHNKVFHAHSSRNWGKILTWRITTYFFLPKNHFKNKDLLFFFKKNFSGFLVNSTDAWHKSHKKRCVNTEAEHIACLKTAPHSIEIHLHQNTD